VSRALAALVVFVAASCGDRALPPTPQVVLAIDTDLPVPLAVSSVRVDLFDENGAWFDSADFARPDPADWPVSFGLSSERAPRRLWVRLRAYPTGQLRDYHDEAPRLVKDGVDVTPASVPWALVAVDRLVALDLVPDAVKHVRITLTGSCLGASARFGPRPDDAATSCIDTEKTLLPVTPAALADDPDATPSRVGTWLAEPCPTTDSPGERICIPGGATVLGTLDLLSGVELAAEPVRTFGLHRFAIDRFEATVGRMRDATARGFVPPDALLANDGPLATSGNGTCTWSTTPRDRESFALNCVSWATARAFCKFLGGDLPTEAQWEHAATVAGRTHKTRYPWGDDEPTCDRAAYGRANGGHCLSLGETPPPPADSKNDLTPLGVVALGGGLSEWVVDKAVPYDDACWIDAPIVDPRCEPAESDAKSVIRGADYVLPEMIAATARLVDVRTTRTNPLGFRCVYPEGAP
jgi:formylglycine-generating enzyme required for sulfatase activity